MKNKKRYKFFLSRPIAQRHGASAIICRENILAQHNGMAIASIAYKIVDRKTRSYAKHQRESRRRAKPTERELA